MYPNGLCNVSDVFLQVPAGGHIGLLIIKKSGCRVVDNILARDAREHEFAPSRIKRKVDYSRSLARRGICYMKYNALRGCLAVKFDFCNNLLSSAHTIIIV